MFVLLAILTSAAILGFMYHISQTKESGYRRKFELVSDLRHLVYFLRQHRLLTHNALTTAQRESELIEDAARYALYFSDRIVEKANADSKPVYRILQVRIKKLLTSWEEKSIGKNQMMHGKAIRHCLFLVDEVMLSWLVEKQKPEMSDKYNHHWQQIFDSLEYLTRFRINIQSADNEIGISRLKSCATSVDRRLNQLALLSPLAITSPDCADVLHQLNTLIESPSLSLSEDELYQLSAEISLIIFNAYDDMLESITSEIYEPLPKLIPESQGQDPMVV